MFNNSFNLKLIITSAVVTSVVGLLLWRKKKCDKAYIKIGKVKNLYFFPIKTLKGVEVSQLECTSVGVKYLNLLDRAFMLISGDGLLLSLRQEPSLALLSVSLEEDNITVTSGDGNSFKLNISNCLKETQSIIECRIHKTSVKAVDCGDAAAEFFNTYLGRNDVRLVRYSPDISKRLYAGKEPFYKKLLSGSPFTFQDLSPVHIIMQSSLDVLNSKSEDRISVFNFRPNILMDDSLAFDEDNWKHLKFSSGAVLDALLPCNRCMLTTVNPETGVKTNKDPVHTLRKFRMVKDPELSRILDHAPCMGVYCWLQKSGFVSAGDEVFAVIEKGYVEYKIEEK